TWGFIDRTDTILQTRAGATPGKRQRAGKPWRSFGSWRLRSPTTGRVRTGPPSTPAARTTSCKRWTAQWCFRTGQGGPKAVRANQTRRRENKEIDTGSGLPEPSSWKVEPAFDWRGFMSYDW